MPEWSAFDIWQFQQICRDCRGYRKHWCLTLKKEVDPKRLHSGTIWKKGSTLLKWSHFFLRPFSVAKLHFFLLWNSSSLNGSTKMELHRELSYHQMVYLRLNIKPVPVIGPLDISKDCKSRRTCEVFTPFLYDNYFYVYYKMWRTLTNLICVGRKVLLSELWYLHVYIIYQR